MPRRIIRIQDSTASVARESPFESEAQLHKAVMEHLEILPSEDLNLGLLIPLATELDLGSGPMDLLAADPQGRIVIIEFKRGTENPDVRQVVAQMLDYGSALWQKPYDEVERTILKKQLQAASSLAELAENRFKALEIPLDAEAFISGVTGCLERGNFVFMYVARDLDQRTKRLMTYLADGAQMTFFAVEMDYFTDGTSANAVLVPRTAFIPSWIASGEAAGRRGARAQGYDLASAVPEVRSLVENMNEVVGSFGLDVRPGPTGPYYYPPAREEAVSFWMGVGINVAKATANFNLLALRELGESTLADNLLARLRQMTGIPKLPPSWPTVSCSALVKDWPLTRRELMETYFAGRMRHRAGAANNPDGSAIEG